MSAQTIHNILIGLGAGASGAGLALGWTWLATVGAALTAVAGLTGTNLVTPSGASGAK